MINSLIMTKHLLRSIKDYVSCVRSMMLSIQIFDGPVPNVFKQIARQCKNPNAPDVFGITPLCHATKCGKLEIVETLLEIGKRESFNDTYLDQLWIFPNHFFVHGRIFRFSKRSCENKGKCFCYT